MRAVLVILAMTFVVCGCTTKSTVRLKEQNAFLAGQNAALRQQAQTPSAFPTVSILRPVQNAAVPWLAGLTLTQAITTA